MTMFYDIPFRLVYGNVPASLITPNYHVITTREAIYSKGAGRPRMGDIVSVGLLYMI